MTRSSSVKRNIIRNEYVEIDLWGDKAERERRQEFDGTILGFVIIQRDWQNYSAT